MTELTRSWLTNQRFIKGFTLSCYLAAELYRTFGRKNSAVSSVAHVSPSYFSDESTIGGGERYPTALAEAMTAYADTVLISFGARRRSLVQGKLRVEIYPAMGDRDNPVSYGFLKDLASFDVIHCHQYKTYASNLAIAVGGVLGKRVFVTDHGGGGSFVTDRVPLSHLVERFLSVSYFSAKLLPDAQKTQTIYGGVREEFLEKPNKSDSTTKVLYIGRILPHKGIDYLIEAIDSTASLEVIGRVYDRKYYSLLQERARNKPVKFITDGGDDEILAAYRSALVTVLPSVYRDLNGKQHVAPELLGLVLLESMACGTPVICTDVGGMPEIVRDGITGYIVPPNDSTALKQRINWLVANPDKATQMGRQARLEVLEKYTWDSVAKRCLEAYQQTEK
jgi:glycosyltransferase involved in cell wall biosynthesis